MEIVHTIPENKLENFAFENNNKENPLKVRNKMLLKALRSKDRL